MAFPYKTVLIVGCTAGIGVALAEQMIANGSFVIAVGRRKERLDAFVSKHGSDKAGAVQFDITNLGGIKQWVDRYVSIIFSGDSRFKDIIHFVILFLVHIFDFDLIFTYQPLVYLVRFFIY